MALGAAAAGPGTDRGAAGQCAATDQGRDHPHPERHRQHQGRPEGLRRPDRQFGPRKGELEKKQSNIAQLQDQLRKGSNTMSDDAKKS